MSREAFHEHTIEEGELRDAPKWLRWSMAFINRVGFPIVVCIFLAWLCLFKMEEGRESVERNTGAIQMLTEAVKSLKR